MGKRRIGGRHWLSQARPGAAGSMDGYQILRLVEDLNRAASTGSRAVGRGPEARLEFPRPGARFAAAERRLAVPPKTPSEFLRAAYHGPKFGAV